MNTFKCSNNWTIRLGKFSEDKRKEVKKLAEKERMSVGAYVAKLLDGCIEKAKEADCGSDVQ